MPPPTEVVACPSAATAKRLGGHKTNRAAQKAENDRVRLGRQCAMKLVSNFRSNNDLRPRQGCAGAGSEPSGFGEKQQFHGVRGARQNVALASCQWHRFIGNADDRNLPSPSSPIRSLHEPECPATAVHRQQPAPRTAPQKRHERIQSRYKLSRVFEPQSASANVDRSPQRPNGL